MLRLPAQRRASQAQTALTLDYNHPLVKALDPVAVYSPLNGGMYDFVAQRYLTPMNGATIVPGHRGMAGYSASNATESSSGQIWDTGLLPTASMRCCFGLFTVVDLNNLTGAGDYYCGTHDGVNRFYLGQTFSYSPNDLIAAWGDAYLAPMRRTTLVAGLTETIAFSVTSGNDMRLFEDGILVANGPAAMSAPLTRSFKIGKRTSNVSAATVLEGTGTLTHLIVIGRGAPSDAAHFALAQNPWQIFKPVAARWVAGSQVSLPTLGRPVSDTSTGQWSPSSGTTLCPMLNETVASDADFISVAALSSCEVLLTETSYPGTAEQTISYRASSSSGNGNGLTVTLKQSGSTIASWSHALSSTVTTYTQTLTAAQIALIGAGPLSVILTST